MNLQYLRHLARLGEADIHPYGARGSAALLAALQPGDGHTVLDLGCGTGATLQRLAGLRRLRLIGLDVLPPMLETARLRLQGSTVRPDLLLSAPGLALPLRDASVDRIYTESVLGFQEVEASRAMLAEIRRVLRPGGRYVANEAVWRAGRTPEKVEAVNERAIRDFGLRQASPEPWSLPEWVKVVQEAGLTVLSANLLDDVIVARGEIAEHAVPPAERVPGLVRSQRDLQAEHHYRSLMKFHRDDGREIEPILLVAEKPAT